MSTETIAPRSEFQARVLNSDARIMIVGGAMGCVPAETEVLTETGWIAISDWGGQPIGAVELDLEDKHHAFLKFEQPEGYIKLPCEEMKSIESSRFKMTLSDEHRVPYFYSEPSNRRVLVTTFEDVVERHNKSKNKGFSGRFHTALSGKSGGKGIPLNEWELRLQVAVLADGHFVPEGANNYCQISLSKDRKVERLKYLCEMGDIPLRHLRTDYLDRYASGKIDIFVVHPKIRVKTYTDIFWQATYEQLQIIVDEVAHWDGSARNESKGVTSPRYFSKHKEDADFIQYAASVCGYTSTIVKDNREGKESYTVNMSGVKSRSFANKDGKCPVKTYKTTDGYKYCFTTSTGFFLVREAGRVFVTGNSSKSYVGLMRHLRWVHDPNYVGYCIRQNATSIMAAGGLFNTAVEMYRTFDPNIKVRTRDKQIVFSSGATVNFNHYENDNAGRHYQGLQLSNVMYDEAAHASEEHIWWLFSRLRSKADTPHSIWLTCNPDPDSYLFDWVKWWLYPEGHPNYGLPDPDKNGKRRYAVRQSGELKWGDTLGEVIELYGNPRLTHDHPLQVKPISIEAHLGTVYDNPPLIAMRPDYVSNLEALPEVEKQRNLFGNWVVRVEGSGYFRRLWTTELTTYHREEGTRTVRAFDFAGSLKSDINPYPDYTASVRMNRTKEGDYVIDDVRRHRIRYGDWKRFVLDCAKDDPPDTIYLIPVDPNAMARKATEQFARELSEAGLSVRQMNTRGSKVDRFRPFSSMAQNGGVSFVKNCGMDYENKQYNTLDFVYKELEAFDGQRRGGENGKDDRQTCRL